MKNLKILSLLAAFVLCAACFTACDKDNGEKQEVDTPVNQPGTDIAEQDPSDPNALELPEDLDIAGETFSMYIAQ